MYSLSNYESLIQTALKSGFQFRLFNEAPRQDRSLILRFDIDYSLTYALQIAELNQRLGIAGTFFLRSRNNLYNPASFRAQKLIDSIRSAGQSIALHIELPLPEAHFPSDQDLQDFIENEFALASQLIGDVTPLFSWHNPSSFSQSQQAYVAFQPKGFLNAYAPAFIQDIRYLSDSNLRYTFDEFIEMFTAPVSPHIQLLLHPYQWMQGSDSVDAILAKTMAHQIAENECEFQYNHVFAKRHPQGLGKERLDQIENAISNQYFSKPSNVPRPKFP